MIQSSGLQYPGAQRVLGILRSVRVFHGQLSSLIQWLVPGQSQAQTPAQLKGRRDPGKGVDLAWDQPFLE